ncbi:hypothetical protein [Carboxydothermus pertinax]|uniref:Uncharacterized protein n=1 Tax=Carboxydothermus pertinax TaxID=870242 RepID=A0A1L8CSC0_9THEO|nr:hypothetical protein [Carboxydothermus pertinax]GAV21835.1 hypothetical protein cpu_03450 [Carboxydothermus pertinax]
MDIPKAMQGLNFVKPPREFVDFAKRYGVENVVFVDDERCERSLRFNNNIFIKITGHWDVYILFPIQAKTFSEVITLRFLHEVGHVYHKHRGSLNDTEKLNITYTSDPWRDTFTGDEGEAWFFAFKIRKYNRDDYKKLVISCEKFLEVYNYNSEIYWGNIAEEEWKRINNCPLPQDISSYCPKWLIEKYNKI